MSLPRLAKGAHNPELKAAFASHLEETKHQVTRLEEIAKLLETKPTGKKCVGMEGCIGEGSEALEEEGNETVLDLGLVGAGSRVEHYVMAGYITATSLARQMGKKEIVGLLTETLGEEQAAEKKLRSIALGLLKTAPSEE